MTASPQVAILGVGWLGETIAARLLAGGCPPAGLLLTHRRPERCEELEARLGVKALADNREAAAAAKVILIGVRPQQLAALVAEIAPAVGADQIVVSLAAVPGIDWFRAQLPGAGHVCRVMLPPSVATGGGPPLAVIEPPGGAGAAVMEDLFRPVAGELVWLPDDAALDALVVTVLGLAPYLARLLVSLSAWAAEHGADHTIVDGLMLTSLTGVSGQFAADGGFEAGLEHASTPGGLTEAAFAAMDRHGFSDAIDAGPAAMLARAAELRRAFE